MSGNTSKAIAFNYFGGKFTWLDHLYRHFPDRFTNLVDCFAGSMVVSLNYHGRVIKMANELNGDITNFFEVLRNREDELIRLLSLTPCSEAEYYRCWEPTADPLEQARRFYVRVRQSFFGLGAQRKNKGWHMAKAMGQDKPQLKKWIKCDEHAIRTLEAEISANIDHLREHGLFFSFTTDPLLPETGELTFAAVKACLEYGVPVNLLTKRADFGELLGSNVLQWDIAKRFIAFGFTLTGHDELEPGASSNAERIAAMRNLHEAGFKTWASIEPIVDFQSSLDMIRATTGFCDLYKIGLMSGKKYDTKELQSFVCKALMKTEEQIDTNEYVARKMLNLSPVKAIITDKYIYFKDSLLKQAGIDRANLPGNCVNRDFNIFKQQ